MEPQNNEVTTTNQRRSPPERALKPIDSNLKTSPEFDLLVVLFYTCLRISKVVYAPDWIL